MRTRCPSCVGSRRHPELLHSPFSQDYGRVRGLLAICSVRMFEIVRSSAFMTAVSLMSYDDLPVHQSR